MSDLNVQISEQGAKGHAFVGDESYPSAEMTYSRAGETMLIIDHTEVGESLRGQGVGRLMLDQVVQMARDKNLKVIPLCPYARSVFNKDESIRDVLRGS